MRLEKHDIETVLPVILEALTKNGKLNIKQLHYHWDEQAVAIQTEFIYAGLAIKAQVKARLFAHAGALGIEVMESYVDSLLMKGDLLTFLRPLLKGSRYGCVDGQMVFFYHPRLELAEFIMDENGWQFTFK